MSASRLRAELRQAGIDDVIESHPAGYRLAVPPGEVLAVRCQGELRFYELTADV